MESHSIPSSGIFSLQVLVMLGVTVALVSAVAVILYNKIQQQGEKLSAVMELSTVLAQEVRSHEALLKQMQPHNNVSHSASFVDSSSIPPQNIVFMNPDQDDNITRIYVSDGSVNSDDEETYSIIQPTQSGSLDNILMNPMCFAPSHNNLDEIDISDDDEYSIGDESNNTEEESDEESDEDENIDGETSTELHIHSEKVEEVQQGQQGQQGQQDDKAIEVVEFEDLGRTSSEKRMITLSEVSIEHHHDEEENDTMLDIHKVVMDIGDNVIDYKKISANELRRIAIERQLIDKGTKMKKPELIDLLTNV